MLAIVPRRRDQGYGASQRFERANRRDAAQSSRIRPARIDMRIVSRSVVIAAVIAVVVAVDALARDRIGAVRYRTTKTLTTSTIFLLISVGLFLFHWRWVRRLNGTASP